MLAHLGGSDVGDVDRPPQRLVDRGHPSRQFGAVRSDHEAVSLAEGLQGRAQAEELGNVCDLEAAAQAPRDLLCRADGDL